MFSALLLSIATVALCQFGLFYWRAVVAGVAAQPVSDRVLEAAQVEKDRFAPEHFETLAGLLDLTSDLCPERGGLGAVRLYYRLTCVLDKLAGPQLPALAAWSNRERLLCARYAAVQVDRRLQANLELAASMRSC